MPVALFVGGYERDEVRRCGDPNRATLALVGLGASSILSASKDISTMGRVLVPATRSHLVELVCGHEHRVSTRNLVDRSVRGITARVIW